MARLIPIDCEADSSFTSQRYYHRTADAEWLMSPIERPTFLLSISPRWRGDRYRHAGACDASYHVAFSTDYSYLVSQLSSVTLTLIPFPILFLSAAPPCSFSPCLIGPTDSRLIPRPSPAHRRRPEIQNSWR